MDKDQQLHQAMVRLKWLKSNSDSRLDLDEYKYKFEKIMNVLDQNDINIDHRLEDLLFNAGLPDRSKHFRNIDYTSSSSFKRKDNSNSKRITNENELESKYKREFKEDKNLYRRKDEDENNNFDATFSKDKESNFMNSLSTKRDLDLKRSRDDDNYGSRNIRRRSDSRYDDSNFSNNRNLSPKHDDPPIIDLTSFSNRYEIGEKIDFLEYHKSHGHCDNETLEKQAIKHKIEIVNRRDCDNCLNHKVMIDFLKDLKPKQRSHKSLEVIHCYLSAEFPVTGFTGTHRVKSFFLLIDDYTRMIFIYTVRNENEVIHILFKFLKHCEKFQELGVRTIVTEDRSEFIDPELEIFLRKNNIGHEKTNKSNDFVNYYVRNVQIMLKLLIADADDIDPSLWSEAIKCAVYIYNNLPNKFLNWMTPCEKWMDKSLVCANRLYPFGSWFMAQFEQNTYRRNFSSARYSKCRFVGYHPHEADLFRFYNPFDKSNFDKKTIGFGKIAYRLDSPRSKRFR